MFHDLVHVSHYEKNNYNYNFEVGNNNKILIWHYINLYKSTNKNNPFYNGRLMIDKEIKKEKNLSKYMKLILFYIIHEDRDNILSDLIKLKKYLSYKLYHLDYYNIFKIIDKIIIFLKKDILKNKDVRSNTLLLKYFYKYGIEIKDEHIYKYRYDMTEALLLLIFILEKIINKEYLYLHDYLRQNNIEDILKDIHSLYNNIYLNNDLFNKQFTYLELVDEPVKSIYQIIEEKTLYISALKNKVIRNEPYFKRIDFEKELDLYTYLKNVLIYIVRNHLYKIILFVKII